MVSAIRPGVLLILSLGQLAIPIARAAPKETAVYESDFGKRIEVDSWSVSGTELGPKSGERLLGRFATHHGVKLSLDGLPEHQFVRVRVTLVTLNSWSGNSETFGSHTWHVMDDHAGLLLHTNFANPPRPGQAEAGATQSFPDEFSLGRHAAGTGAARRAAHGFPQASDTAVHDCEYDLEFVYPHDADALGLKFAGLISRPEDGSWGLKKVAVSVIDGPSGAGGDALEKAWVALRSDDAAMANSAKWEFLAAGAAGRDFLDAKRENLEAEERKRRAEAMEELRDDFQEQLKALDSERFLERQQAVAAIIALGGDVLPLVEAARKNGPPIGVDRALAMILKRLREAAGDDGKPSAVEGRLAQIDRIFSTVARGYTVSSSFDQNIDRHDSLAAVNDGLVPPISGTPKYPHFRWWPETGKAGWLQYTFPKPKKVSQAEVFWLIHPLHKVASTPKSWVVEYRDGRGNWQKVATRDAYELEPDRFNTVNFDPVETDAIRLKVEMQDDITTGLFEFRVGG